MVVETLNIIALSPAGEGIAQRESGPVFVPFALPGERVNAEVERSRAKLISLVQTSPDRTAAPCEYFSRCGGCSVQHMSERTYRQWKRSLVIAALKRRNIEAAVTDLVDAHGLGRRRVVLHVRGSRAAPMVGFMASRTHALVDLAHCPLLETGLSGIFPASRAIAGLADAGNSGFDLQFTSAANGMDCEIRGLPRHAGLSITDLAGIATAHGIVRLSRHGEVLIQTERPAVRCGKAMVQIPPGAFLQATAAAQSILAATVLKYAGTGRNAVDLFCGVGPFSLELSEHMAVTAIDLSKPAIIALREAGSRTRGLRPIAVEARDLFREPLSVKELEPFDVIVFNPPRQGAEAQCRNLALAKAKTIVAVSCNPDTFARDAGLLTAGGYSLREVTPVDQFRWSSHVELVGLFSRTPKKS